VALKKSKKEKQMARKPDKTSPRYYNYLIQEFRQLEREIERSKSNGGQPEEIERLRVKKDDIGFELFWMEKPV